MQVETASVIIGLVIIFIGVMILAYANHKNDLFCWIVGPSIVAIGMGLLIYINVII